MRLLSVERKGGNYIMRARDWGKRGMRERVQAAQCRSLDAGRRLRDSFSSDYKLTAPDLRCRDGPQCGDINILQHGNRRPEWLWKLRRARPLAAVCRTSMSSICWSAGRP